jgi:hypothetical protein
VRGSGALHLFKKTLNNPCKKRALSGDLEETGSMQRFKKTVPDQAIPSSIM